MPESTSESHSVCFHSLLETLEGFTDFYQDKEGPIHDAAWSPNGREFGVVYGYMPAKATIFNLRGAVVHSFGSLHRNTIRFSPHGRFLLVCGFGNLSGYVDIYDTEKKFNLIRSFQAPSPSVCEWSPDGRFMLMATTSPRLRVDNAVYIYHANGDMIHCEEYDELYGVQWRPQPTSEFPLREKEELQAPPPQPSAAAWLKTHGTKKESVGAYRPPGTRGIPLSSIPAGAPNASSTAYMLNGYKGKRTIPGVTPKTQPSSVPGAAGEEKSSKSAAKNKKRQAKKAKEEAGGGEQRQKGPEDGDQSRNQHPKQVTSSEETAKPLQYSGGQSSEDGGVEVNPPPPIDGKGASQLDPQQEKKTRGLLKKIRAIEELKMRVANGEHLEETQRKKIDKEESLRKELHALGGAE